MKFVLLGLLAVLCIADAAITKNKLPNSFQNLIRFQRSVELVSHSLDEHKKASRSKRDLSEFLTLHCIQGCVQTMTNEMTAAGLTPNDNAGGIINPQIYQGTSFQDYCDTGLEAKSCINDCISGSRSSSSALVRNFKESMDLAFSVFNFLCVDHKQDFMNSLSCYRRSEDQVQSTCSPKCGDAVETARKAQRDIQAAAAQRDLNKISKVLEDLCVFLRCTMKCEATVITEVCEDRQPAALLYDFAQVSVQSVEQLLRRIPGAMEFWPPTCRKISSGERMINQMTSTVDESSDNDVDEPAPRSQPDGVPIKSAVFIINGEEHEEEIESDK